MDNNGLVSPDDALLFTASYIACSPVADVNRDTWVNSSDSDLFWASYACQCNP